MWCGDGVSIGEFLRGVACALIVIRAVRSHFWRFPERFSADFIRQARAPAGNSPPSRRLFQMRGLLTREHRPDLQILRAGQHPLIAA